MMLDPRLYDAWARLPDYLGSHVLVSLTALALGLGISLPLAILSMRRPVLRGTLLGVASVIQTIPGIQGDPNDLETPMKGGQDHHHDAVVYSCAYASRGAAGIPMFGKPGSGSNDNMDDDDDDEDKSDASESRGQWGYG